MARHRCWGQGSGVVCRRSGALSKRAALVGSSSRDDSHPQSATPLFRRVHFMFVYREASGLMIRMNLDCTRALWHVRRHM